MNLAAAGCCTGCFACVSICKAGAIKMREDAEGFLQPHIDLESCTKCGACESVCPILSSGRMPAENSKPTLYAAWHSNPETRGSSSSGGIFSALAESVLDQGGVVFGAAWTEDLGVYHKCICDKSQLVELRKSKYVQSTIGDALTEVKLLLNSGSRVLFSGTSCQIAGLYAFLGRNYPNLTTCDFICHGVPSPKLFRDYLKYLENKYHSRPICIDFRDKRQGWSHAIRIGFADGRELACGYMADPYYRAFIKNICLRPCCHDCQFRGLSRSADITVGDFWEIDQYVSTLNDGKGTSILLLNSERGKALYQACADTIISHECPLRYLEGNVCLFRSVLPDSKREQFFRELDIVPFSKLSKKYMRFPNIYERLVNKIIRGFQSYLRRFFRSLSRIQ